MTSGITDSGVSMPIMTFISVFAGLGVAGRGVLITSTCYSSCFPYPVCYRAFTCVDAFIE